VTATAINPTSKPLPNIAIYGYVLDQALGVSVVGNTMRNDRERSHAGQIAKLASIPPGKSRVQFTFIATIAKENAGRLPALSFSALKGTSSPGGKVLNEFGPCEIDSMSAECAAESDE
jgi:hypothetical protein